MTFEIWVFLKWRHQLLFDNTTCCQLYLGGSFNIRLSEVNSLIWTCQCLNTYNEIETEMQQHTETAQYKAIIRRRAQYLTDEHSKAFCNYIVLWRFMDHSQLRSLNIHWWMICMFTLKKNTFAFKQRTSN